MPKLLGTKNTTPEIHSLVCQLALGGTPLPEIANSCQITLRTTQPILKNYKERGYNCDASRSGRPPKLDQRALRHLSLHLERDRRQSLSDLTSTVNNFANSHISRTTVKRAIKDKLGMKGHVAAKKPFLKKVHKQRRLIWARAHRTWEEKDWHHVIWTDEASVEIGKESRVVWVWRRPGERYDEKCTVPTFKSGRQSLMIWGCIAHGRLGPLIRIPKEEKSGADYVRLVFAGPLLDFYSELCEERGVVAVMEDGAPVHCSKVAKNFRTAHQMEIFSHPAQSPDINPIEHVWKILKTKINERPVMPRNVDEMWVALQEEWTKFDVGLVNGLIKSMSERVEAVTKVKGGSTKY